MASIAHRPPLCTSILSNHRRALVAVRDSAAFHLPLKSPVRRRCGIQTDVLITTAAPLTRTRQRHAIVRAPLDFPIMPPPAASTCSGSSIGSFVACSSFARPRSSSSMWMSSPAPVRYEPHRHRLALVPSAATQSQPSYAGSTVHNVPCRLSFPLPDNSTQSTTAVRARGETANFFASSPARDYYTFTCGPPLPQCRDASLARLSRASTVPGLQLEVLELKGRQAFATPLINAICTRPQASVVDMSSASHSVCLPFLHHAHHRTVTS